ncbi:MAG: emp24/gp25L/p24 family protein [Aureliella sp.]
MSNKQLWGAIPLLAGFAACSTLVAAEPIIESVSPPVVKAGTEVELSISGEGFEGCKELVFYSSRIRCLSVQTDSDYELKAVVKVEGSAGPINQPFRVLSAHGFSDLRTLRVTPFNVATEEKAKSEIRTPSVPLSISGLLESGDIDEFSFRVEKGERFSAEVEAVRLGYELLDTVVKIKDPDGNIVAKSDDDPLFQQDPVISIVAPESGVYKLCVHESNYQGSLTSHYVLHVGSFARPGVAMPAGGQAGRTVKVDLMDTNGVRSTHTLRIPSDPREFFFLPSIEGVQVPTPLPFRVSEFASVREQEPNDIPIQTDTSSQLPVAFDGILERGDVDHYRLTTPVLNSDSEVRVRVEAFADRVGSPIDTMLRVFDVDGELVATNDDWGSHDSRVEFFAPGETEYLIEVSDKLGGGAKNGVYRLEVTEAKPELRTFLPRPDRVSQDSQTISVPRGNRVMKRVAVRREYIDGDVSLQFIGLPPGVHASPLVVAEDEFWVPAVLQADPEAEIGGSLARISANCTVDGEAFRGEFEQTVDLVHSTADQLFNSVTVDRVPVAVTPEVPFELELLTPRVALPAGGKLALNVSVARSSGFNEPIRVRLPFLPPWIISPDHVLIPANEEKAVIELQATNRAEPRVWQIVATAEVDALSSSGEIESVAGRQVCSTPVDLKITGSPVAGEFETLAGVQGESVEAVCNLKVTPEFVGTFEATLEGLPARVTADPVTVTHQDQLIKLKIQIASDAPIGSFSGIQCRLTGESNGQAVSYVVAEGTSLTTMESGKLIRDSSGRVLSPLEALRARQASSTSRKE